MIEQVRRRVQRLNLDAQWRAHLLLLADEYQGSIEHQLGSTAAAGSAAAQQGRVPGSGTALAPSASMPSTTGASSEASMQQPARRQSMVSRV